MKKQITRRDRAGSLLFVGFGVSIIGILIGDESQLSFIAAGCCWIAAAWFLFRPEE